MRDHIASAQPESPSPRNLPGLGRPRSDGDRELYLATESLDACCIIVFTDVSGSTSMVETYGDEIGARLMDFHARVVRHVVRGHGGREVRSRGDGFVIIFRSVKNALRFALGVREMLATNAPPDLPPLRIRIGVHAGEPVRVEGELHGVAMHKAARIAASAEPSEILVSDVVRQLSEGKSFTFRERGELTLKGLTGPVRVCALEDPVAVTGVDLAGLCVRSVSRSDVTVPVVVSKSAADLRVLVTHHQASVRESIGAFLAHQPRVRVLATVPTAEEGIAAVGSEHPDIVIVALRTATGGALLEDDVAALRRIRATLPWAEVVALVPNGELGTIRQARHAGVCGCLVEGSSMPEVAHALQLVAQGRTYVEPRAEGLAFDAPD